MGYDLNDTLTVSVSREGHCPILNSGKEVRGIAEHPGG